MYYVITYMGVRKGQFLSDINQKKEGRKNVITYVIHEWSPSRFSNQDYKGHKILYVNFQVIKIKCDSIKLLS